MLRNLTGSIRLQRASGRCSTALLLLLCSFVLFIALGWLAVSLRPGVRVYRDDEVIRVYCASAVAGAVQCAITEYEHEYGGRVEVLRTGGSGTLYGQIQAESVAGVSGGADLFISADDELLERGFQAGVLDEPVVLATQVPIIAVPAASDLHLTSLADLVKPSPAVRYAIAMEGAAIGRLTRQIAAREGVLAPLIENAKTEAENVMSLAQAVLSGSVEAAVIWDTTLLQVNEQAGEQVLRCAQKLDNGATFVGRIAVGVVRGTDKRTQGQHLVKYLSASDRGLKHLKQAGFEVVEGKKWEEP